MHDLVIRGATLMLPWGPAEVDLAVADGRIATIGDVGPAKAELDARGLHVLPGVIDTQVHFREPGATHKEDLESGSRAAVAGGVTTVFEMPNTEPTTTTADALADKLTRARGRMWCDHAFFIGATPDNVDELPRLERLPGAAGVKVFMGSSTGNLLLEDEDLLARVFATVRRRVSLHAEDEARLRERRSMLDSPGVTVHDHPRWRDVETAVIATTRLLRLARANGARVHVLHISTAEELPILAEHRDVATVEATPQHLTLAAPDCYDELGTRAQMNPPLREVPHREALWRAVATGLVDVLGSDHAPHTAEEKRHAYPGSHSGMPGVQTLLPVMLDHVAAGRLSLQHLVEITATGPARVFGIAAKGRIALGYDADLVLVDLQARRRIEGSWLQSRAGWSPFEGRTVTGWPVATVLRGEVVMRDGELQGLPRGRLVRFVETLAP